MCFVQFEKIHPVVYLICDLFFNIRFTKKKKILKKIAFFFKFSYIVAHFSNELFIVFSWS